MSSTTARVTVGALMKATMLKDEPAVAYLPDNVSECVSCLVQSICLPPCVTNLWPADSAGLSVAANVDDVSVSESELGLWAPCTLSAE